MENSFTSSHANAAEFHRNMLVAKSLSSFGTHETTFNAIEIWWDLLFHLFDAFSLQVAWIFGKKYTHNTQWEQKLEKTYRTRDMAFDVDKSVIYANVKTGILCFHYFLASYDVVTFEGMKTKKKMNTTLGVK